MNIIQSANQYKLKFNYNSSPLRSTDYYCVFRYEQKIYINDSAGEKVTRSYPLQTMNVCAKFAKLTHKHCNSSAWTKAVVQH